MPRMKVLMGVSLANAAQPEVGQPGFFFLERGGHVGPGADEARAPITVAQIAVVTGEGTPAETQRVFRVPMRRAGELTLVAAFAVR